MGKEIKTSSNNCYFGILKHGQGLSYNISAIYLLTDDGKNSFYGEIISNDLPESIKDSMYGPSTKIEGENWEICGTKDDVRDKMILWLIDNYKNKNREVQLVGDCNELDFVLLNDFILDGSRSSYKQISIEPTMDNINIGIANVISNMCDDRYDGFTMIAYHANREEILAYLDKEYTFEPDIYDIVDTGFCTDFKKSVWVIRDIKRAIVYINKLNKDKKKYGLK